MSRRNVKLRLVLLDSRQVNHTAAVGLAEGTSDRVKVEDVLCCFEGVKLVRAWVLDHDDDDDDEFPTFLGASGLSAVTFPTDTVYRLRGESGAHENPPPKEATTLQTLPSKWRAADALEDTIHCTWEHQSAGECGQQYIAYMDQHRGDLQRLGRRLQMQVCRNEPDEEGSYKCLAENYLAIADYFRGQANAQARNLVLGYAVNKTAVTQGKETRSDVLLYATSEEGEVGSRLLDKVLFTVAQMKTVNCSPDALKEGLGQILQKANIAMRARSVRYHQLAGSVHTGEKLQSVLVTAHAGSQANTAVCTRMLQLVTDSSSSSHMRRINCDSQGWWEMVWHVYHGLYSQLQHLRLAAQAQILDESLPPDVDVLVQLGACPDTRVRDQRGVLVCRLLNTFSGVFTGTVQTGSGSMQEVFVKIGHPPACQALAIHLGQPWEPWYQVERELAVRCGLQTPPRNLAPLVAGGPVVGVLSSSDDRSSNNSSSSARASSNSSNNNRLTDTRDNCYPGLVGRSVLVLCRTGIPLVQGVVLPVLALHEAMQLLICLLMLVLDLLDNGVYWNDLRPNNIGINPSAPPSHRYYGFDLGAASSKAVDVWACKTVYPGEQRKLLPSEYSPVSDLEYGSLEAIQGEELNSSCDLQSAVYTTYALAGNVLPWKAAADAGGVQAVIRARLSAAADPAMMPGLTAWPQNVQQLAHAAMRGEQHAATIARQIAANPQSVQESRGC